MLEIRVLFVTSQESSLEGDKSWERVHSNEPHFHIVESVSGWLTALVVYNGEALREGFLERTPLGTASS